MNRHYGVEFFFSYKFRDKMRFYHFCHPYGRLGMKLVFIGGYFFPQVAQFSLLAISTVDS